jgi:hypothetical protein
MTVQEAEMDAAVKLVPEMGGESAVRKAGMVKFLDDPLTGSPWESLMDERRAND